MNLISQFPSTRLYLATLTELVDSSTAERWVCDWLTQEFALVDNPEFSELFRGHFDRFSAPAEDYTHRLISVGPHQVLGGIRFFGGDFRRPFVEVVAWGCESLLPLDELKSAVRREWEVFEPFALRLILPKDRVPSSAQVDHMVYVAAVKDMTASPNPAVRLQEVDDVEEASRLVKAGYESIEDQALAADISPVYTDELEDCLRNGTLDYILHNDERVGLIASQPNHDFFVHGQVVMEEVVSAKYRGQGLAQSGQLLMAQHLAETDPNLLLFGTIDLKNIASQITAQRCGRSDVFQKVLIDL